MGLILSRVLEGEAARWAIEGRLGQPEGHLDLGLGLGSLDLGSARLYANHFRSQGCSLWAAEEEGDCGKHFLWEGGSSVSVYDLWNSVLAVFSGWVGQADRSTLASTEGMW